MRQKKYFYFIILVFLGTPIFAQTASISGFVKDTRGPLPTANLYIPSLKKGAVTNEHGYYLFNDLQPGIYTIQASFVGYEKLEKTIKLQAGQELELNFLLSEKNDLEEIVVTGTMKPTYISDSPVKVEVFTAKQLQTFLPTAASSLVESIQLVNGVQEVTACGVCFTNSISINGLPGAYTAILMDGTPIYGSLASVYGLNGIPSMIIERFEVIKGPNSTLYGSEAVAGVINIITKDPSKQPLLEVDIMGTSHLESFGNLALAPKIGKANGYVGFNYAYLNDFDDFNRDGFSDGVNMDRYSLFTKWNFNRKSGKKFTLAGKYYYEDRRNGVKAFLEDRAYRDLRGDDSIYGESIYTNRAELFGTYEFHKIANLKLDFSLSHHEQDSYYGDAHYVADQQIAFGNLIYNLDKKNHDVLFGLTTRLQAYDDNSIATQVMGPDSIIENRPDNQFIPGFFIQDEFEASEKWTILGGVRIDHYSSHGPIVSPRLNFKFKAAKWTTIRANFGTGFRVVNLFTEDHAFVTGQRSVIIEESLDPESSYNGSLSVNHVYALGDGTGTIDVETYYTHFTNKIIPNYDEPGKIIYANSDGYARTMGIGLSIDHRFRQPLGINMSFNLQRARETEPDDEGKYRSSDILFSPQWSGIVTASYEWRKYQLVFAYTARVTGNMALPEVFDLDESGNPVKIPRSTESKPFSLHNFQLTKTLKKGFSLYLGIQNLFNFRQEISPLTGFNDPNTSVGFSQYFDTSYAYAPIHGREFYLGVKWSLKHRS